MAADKRGGNKTVRDLILSMLVLGVAVYLIYLFIPHDSKATPVKTESVGYTVELQQARRDAPYPVAGPTGLGSKWSATSVTYSGSDRKNVTWHIGFVDPDQQYVALEQTNGDAAEFITQVTINGHRDAGRTLPVDGVAWQYYTGGRYDALVHEEGGVTTVVLGTAPDAQLQRFAATLTS
ncbi:putative secreted protein [Actinacidiphila reveromycinica]|uniref:Putative secreted protein n=1 Tax=Actinacidiphila reveromycinica TaxID=659352 RepID=A0A7U3UW31_9ACTN|nr:DUF4245 domain-containing protein [Streptomyces sp. SN-593]BBA99806.1 putative secreted protein [Streptomyces sp. SN-593]